MYVSDKHIIHKYSRIQPCPLIFFSDFTMPKLMSLCKNMTLVLESTSHIYQERWLDLSSSAWCYYIAYLQWTIGTVWIVSLTVLQLKFDLDRLSRHRFKKWVNKLSRKPPKHYVFLNIKANWRSINSLVIYDYLQ